MNTFLKDFKEFISRGNVMDMAVGVIIGGAFKSIIDSLVNDIIMPLISKLFGELDFSNLFIALDGNKYSKLSIAQEAGVATLNYGKFITVSINFLLMSLVIFSMINIINAISGNNKKEEDISSDEMKTKICMFCKSEIAIDAVRCSFCTSNLQDNTI